MREAFEELRIKGFEPQFIHKYVWESARERELVFSFMTVSELQPVYNPDEIDEGHYWTINEIRQNIGKDIFTPNFEHEFSLLTDIFNKIR